MTQGILSTVPFADTVPLADTVCYIHNAYVDPTNIRGSVLPVTSVPLTSSEAHLGSASPAPRQPSGTTLNSNLTKSNQANGSSSTCTVPFADTVPLADTVCYIHTSSASEPAHLGSASPAPNSQRSSSEPPRNTFKRLLDRFRARSPSQLSTEPSADTVTSNRL